jgi:hypothetical protein
MAPTSSLERDEIKRGRFQNHGVIPAQAGIHLQPTGTAPEEKMNAGPRRHDAVDEMSAAKFIPL